MTNFKVKASGILLSWCLLGLITHTQAASLDLPISRENTGIKPMADKSDRDFFNTRSRELTQPNSFNGIKELDYIVALVNSEPITRNEVRLKQLQLQNSPQNKTAPSSKNNDSTNDFQQALERLIEERVMLHLAREEGIRVSDTQLDDVLLTIGRQNQLTTLTQMQKSHEAAGGNWGSYRENIRQELLRQQLREREVDARVRVTEAEIDKELKENALNGKGSYEINLAQILIALPDSPTAEEVQKARQKAEEIAQEARKPNVDFYKLAESVSDSADKTKGGAIGLRAIDRYPSLFVEATKNLNLGEISAVVKSDAGFHILKLLEKQATSIIKVTQSRARHILLHLSDQLSEAQAKAKLRHYKTQIELGRLSFTAAAREYSVDSSAAQGGELGWVTQGVFVPEFEQVMNALPIGKISEPFTSRFGVHLLEVMDRKEVALSTKDQREFVRYQIRAKKAVDAYALWVAEIRGRAFIEYKNAAP